jgi:hypothetical protein
MVKRIWIAALLCFSSAFAVDAPVLNSDKTIVDITTACTTATAPALQYFVQQSTGATFKCVGAVLTRWDVPTCPTNPMAVATCSTQSLCKDAAAGDLWGCDSLSWRKFATNPDKNSTVIDPAAEDAQRSQIFTLDHTNDRNTQNQVGGSQAITYSSTGGSSKAGTMIGDRATVTASGSTDGRDVTRMQAFVASIQATATATATAQGISPAGTEAFVANFDWSGTSWTVPHSSALYVKTPTAPGGSGGTQTTVVHYPVHIENQGYGSAGMSGDAILVDSQVTSGGSEGNVRMAGGAFNTGHAVIGATHLWEASSGVLRVKGSTPTTGTDGTLLLTMSAFVGGVTTHGIVAWGRTTAIDANFDSGDELCVSQGMTCQTTFDPGATTVIACATLHTHASTYYTAMCK